MGCESIILRNFLFNTEASMILTNFIKSNFLKLISRGRTRPLVLGNSPKFLILMTQKIGDMIVCSPILREIKFAFPDAELQVLASQTNVEIARENPYIDNVYVYKNQWHKLISLLLILRGLNFDVAIELEAKVVTRSILILGIIRPNCILSVSKTEGRYGMTPQAVLPYDYYTNSELKHQRDTCLDILRLMQIQFSNKSYDVFYSKQKKVKALSFMSSFDKSKITILLNTKGSGYENEIQSSDVLRIIEGLSSIPDVVIILLHKPGDKEWAEGLIKKTPSKYTFLSPTSESILDVAAIIDLVDLVISPDTSIVHMACAFKKPLVAIYTNNLENFERWSPISNHNHVIFSDDENSLKSINVDKIVKKSSELISITRNKYKN